MARRLLPLPFLAAVLLLLASPASGAYSYSTLRRADPSSTAIVHREEDGKTFDYHGNSFLTIGWAAHRPARVVLPEQYFQSDKAFPVILVLHGWGSNGDYHDFYMGVSVRASDLAFGGFIVIIANGTMNEAKHSRFWNARYCCDHNRTNVDDDAYLTGLINEAQNKYRVDDENIYAIGHSNGGVMAQVLGCQHSDLFKGFVGLSPGIIPSMCWDTKVKKVLLVAGTDDTYFPVAYGHDNMKRWGEFLRCPLEPTTEGETRDYDCIPDAPASINDKYDFWRDKNCEKTGTTKETSILEWNRCGPQKDAKQALWLMENNSHNPAFNGKFSDDILNFLLVD